MTTTHRIPARTRHLGEFALKRVLPAVGCRKVGPWVFLDHFGPTQVPAGSGMDVAPHPHCALSTVSFLFEGAVEHRDSTGGHAVVRPGEVHWMRGGHGIVHSERRPKDLQDRPAMSHGLQLWCAHPDGEEEQEPRFDSYRHLPELDLEGVRVQLLAGTGWGQASPVDVTSPLIYALAHMRAGQSMALPDHEERCVYPLNGCIAVDGDAADPGVMLVLDRAAKSLVAQTDGVVALLGGDAIGPRHMWWNLIHSDKGRLIEQAERWRSGDFPQVPGDTEAFIPAPAHGP
ncbi:MAG: pirin family protein [Proteobacteria bacterium]|nr:pirin family protein [Pseudomonadota bacterium]